MTAEAELLSRIKHAVGAGNYGGALGSSIAFASVVSKSRRQDNPVGSDTLIKLAKGLHARIDDLDDSIDFDKISEMLTIAFTLGLHTATVRGVVVSPAQEAFAKMLAGAQRGASVRARARASWEVAAGEWAEARPNAIAEKSSFLASHFRREHPEVRAPSSDGLDKFFRRWKSGKSMGNPEIPA